MLYLVAAREPGMMSTRGMPVCLMTCSGWGLFPGNKAATVSSGSRFRASVGPQKPWLIELCGSMSTRRTRRPFPEKCRRDGRCSYSCHPPFLIQGGNHPHDGPLPWARKGGFPKSGLCRKLA